MMMQTMIGHISQTIEPNKIASSLIVEYIPKPYIICLYKSLEENDIEHLRQHGKVVLFCKSYTNLPIQSFPFDYLILDFRIEEHRYYYQRHIFHNYSNYHLILFRHCFETNNGISFHNELTDFPRHQVLKNELDALLLEKPLPAPNCCLSLFRFCCSPHINVHESQK